ncbi:MAG: SOS-response transcriptional repressor, LexA [Thermoleophilia bacterium]|nr:SOS-response transcriptional repressor, LexA [Thermoleophilia bacterium]
MFDSPALSAPELTDRQQAVLDVLRSHTAEHGYPPTVREIGEVLGMASSSTVHSHLAALERAGIIERDPTKPRALKWGPAAATLGIDATAGGSVGATGPTSGGTVTSIGHGNVDVDASVTMPLLGRVAAGAPILAEEHVEEYVPVPKKLTRSGESFLLKVRGDSMEGAGILDGDWVVVRKQKDASNGQIVIALVGDDEEATCKRYERRAGHVELHSENPAYEPIVTDQVEIAGIVTGVMRAI